MSDLIEAWLDARRERQPVALVTVVKSCGSTPRDTGAKMLVFSSGETRDTIGGGKLEALVIAAALDALAKGSPRLETLPLHPNSEDAFGAICGGEMTFFIEPTPPAPRLFIVGAGHCAQALAPQAAGLGYAITVIDDREDMLAQPGFAQNCTCISDRTAEDVFGHLEWTSTDAVVIVSRNFEIDTAALAAVVENPDIAYIGMIGSQRKVNHVFDTLRSRGVAPDALQRPYAPIGLDIGAESPTEIAISVIAELLKVTRQASGDHLRRPLGTESS